MPNSSLRESDIPLKMARRGEELLQSIQERTSYSTFKNLKSVEHKIDSKLLRKQLDIQESSFKSHKIKRMLRIFVNGVVENVDGVDGWCVKVEGRILDPGKFPRVEIKSRFSSLLKSMILKVDSDESDQDHIVEWRNDGNESDGFEIHRKGRASKLSLYLRLNNQPEKYKLSPKLAQLLRTHTDTKSFVFMAIWKYIKLKKLQDVNDKKMINCDSQLEELFGKSLSFKELQEKLEMHLLPMDPVCVETEFGKDAAFDVEIEIEDPNRPLLGNLGSTTSTFKELAALDYKINEIVSLANKCEEKRKFLKSFSDSPAKAIDQWIINQSNDLQQITGENNFSIYDSDYFHSPIVRNAINNFLGK